jgi:hypothetical protein
VIGKWFEDREREGRYYYTLKNLGASDGPAEDRHKHVLMRQLFRYGIQRANK